jgi:hypothetical protein
MDKILKSLKGYSQEREMVSNFFADSESMGSEKIIYVDNKNQKILKFEDDLDSDNQKSASKRK